MCSPETINYKSLYDSLAENTLSNGFEYAWQSMEEEDSLRATQAAKIIKSLEPNSILEVAAGYGFVTKHIQDSIPDAKITCLEIASKFCEILRKQGYDVIEDNFITMQMSSSRKWDVVTIMQVLEHLPDLANLYQVLKRLRNWTNRYVFVEIPEGGPIDGERHILNLNTNLLLEMLKSCEYRVKLVNVVPPTPRQAANGYFGMVQIVGEL